MPAPQLTLSGCFLILPVVIKCETDCQDQPVKDDAGDKTKREQLVKRITREWGRLAALPTLQPERRKLIEQRLYDGDQRADRHVDRQTAQPALPLDGKMIPEP